MRILDYLMIAGEQFYSSTLDWSVQAQVDDLKSKEEVVGAKVRLSAAIKAHFSGRSLFCTQQGFHGLTAPGAELREEANLFLLNGLSFPMMVKDFNEEDGSGRLIGCAAIRGVDLRDLGKRAPKVPKGFVLGKKRVFKLG